MENKFITFSHIEKLGHQLLEIRERALFNLISKLDNGYVFDNVLSRSKELLIKLFNWFLNEPCTQEETVLKLLRRILDSESGEVLISHYGNNLILNELKKIQSYIEPKYLKDIEDLIQITINNIKDIPPLVSDVPLSYRSDSITDRTKTVESTATPFHVYVEQDESYDQQVQPHSQRNPTTDTYRVNSVQSTDEDFTLDWQPLIEPDRRVLKEMEKRLSNPPQPAELIHSCEFFVTVLLHDFPAEVFIQRPNVIHNFFNLLEVCLSSKVINSVLKCLYDLTKALQVRLSQFSDPSMNSYKLQLQAATQNDSARSSSTNRSSGSGSRTNSNSSEKFELFEDTIRLKKLQISLSKYCSLTGISVMKFLCRKPGSWRSERSKHTNQAGLNLAVNLLEETFILLQSTSDHNHVNFKKREFNELLYFLGETMDFFRLESCTSENNLNSRALYLHILHICASTLNKLVAPAECIYLLPPNFKKALSNSLMDVTLSRLYPEVHEILLEYVQNICLEGETNDLKKYKCIKEVCNGMTATVKILNNYKILSLKELLCFAVEALPSLEFHRNLLFVKLVVVTLSDKLYLLHKDVDVVQIAEDITLKLLAHNDERIKEEMYRMCHSQVVSVLGPNGQSSEDSAGSEVLFLLTTKVLTEIAIFGVHYEQPKIKLYAENIINHIIKGKLLMSERMWDKTVEALIPAMPIVSCCCEKETILGKIVINVLDPDTASDLLIPNVTLLKSNAVLMFSTNKAVRDEAFSRICWLLASQDDAREMLPRMNSLYDKALSKVCQQPKVLDLNKHRLTQHFYQPSSVCQIMDVLKSENIEPVIRRSALTQLSVMLEDSLLHNIFLDSDGLESIVACMKSALTEQDYKDYPDSIIPIITLLKNLIIYNSNVRETLSNDCNVITCILRGMFLFFSEERVRQDGSILLFFLLFKDFIMGSPSKANISIPRFVYDTLHVPFICGTHWSHSPYQLERIIDTIINDKWSLSSLQIQWNIEVFGFQKLLKMDFISYDDYNDIDVPDILQISDYDFDSLKRSSIHYWIGKCLLDIQNATSHSVVIESINSLTLYINLYNISKNVLDVTNSDDVLSHSWEKTFKKFLKVLPSSQEDVYLLKVVIKFLQILVPCYKNSDTKCWIIEFLKDPSRCILDLLSSDKSSDEDLKTLPEELLKLISICACQEQHYLDYYTDPSPKTSTTSWWHVIKLLADNLKSSDAQHFYNLAFLDCALSCLANLTATLGWSDSRAGLPPKEPVPQMLRILCEIVVAFHCSKGPSAAVSVMGLSITRHVLLILNHVIAELQNSKVKGWELCFLDYTDEQNVFRNLVALWASRDVVLKAAALQLFNALATSPRIAIEIVQNVSLDNSGVWDLAFSVLVDGSEANIVKENALLLLANLSSHTVLIANDKLSLHTSISPRTRQDSGLQIMSLMEEYDFFNQMDILLNNLFTTRIPDDNYSDFISTGYSSSISSRTSSSKTGVTELIFRPIVTTPSLVKNMSIFLTNVLALAPIEVANKLHENGLLKQLLKSLCVPSVSMKTTRELSLYCDLLEMNTYICFCLSKTAGCSTVCLGTILHTRDCFTVLLLLLNPKIYHTSLPQLTYLRNRLWSEIFHLLTILSDLSTGADKSLHQKAVASLGIFLETINDIGAEPFLETICESLSCTGSTDLQNTALICLASLLRVELIREPNKNDSFTTNSVQTIFDSVRSPRNFIPSNNESNEENIKPKEWKNKDDNQTKSIKDNYFNLLEETYFHGGQLKKLPRKVTQESTTTTTVSECNSLMAGGEICKILMRMYEVEEVKTKKTSTTSKRKSMVLSALSGLLCISEEAKRYAYENGLMFTIMQKLREYVVKLSLDSVECLRKVSDKKRVCPILQEVAEIVGLTTNFMYESEDIKMEGAKYDIADVLHKLWVWFSVQSGYLVNVLSLLCTFTTNCPIACQSLPLTNSSIGSGPKKTPSSLSLLHAIVVLIEKQMNQVSKTHDLTILELCFDILHNCSAQLECRVLLSKGNLFQSMSRLHPAMTKRQKPWGSIEMIWLKFLQTFTKFPEGQACVAKINDALEIILTLTNSPKAENRSAALAVLRNLAFYQPNRARLMSSSEFLSILSTKLDNGDVQEVNTVVVIMWTLAANSQKAKLMLKSANLDRKLQDAIKHYKLIGDYDAEREDIQRMHYVLGILRDNEKVR